MASTQHHHHQDAIVDVASPAVDHPAVAECAEQAAALRKRYTFLDAAVARHHHQQQRAVAAVAAAGGGAVSAGLSKAVAQSKPGGSTLAASGGRGVKGAAASVSTRPTTQPAVTTTTATTYERTTAATGPTAPSAAKPAAVAAQPEEVQEFWKQAAVSWTPEQRALFARVLDILKQAHFARVAFCNVDALHGKGSAREEQVLVSLHLAHAAERLRHLFAEVCWDPISVTWLHTAILELADRVLLEEYVDVLRHLNAKAPGLLEECGLLEARATRKLGGQSGFAATVLKQPDQLFAPRKAPPDMDPRPVMVLCPCEFTWTRGRLAGWREKMDTIGKVFVCPPFASLVPDAPGGVLAAGNIGSLSKALVKRIREIKQRHGKRPVVLVTASMGAKVALMGSQQEPVDTIICLGLQLQGRHANPVFSLSSKELLAVRVPTLFAIGSNARLCPVQAMETTRAQMLTRTKTVVVRDGDDALCIPHASRRKVCLTQAMSDQLVLDEIGDFLAGVLVAHGSSGALGSDKGSKKKMVPGGGGGTTKKRRVSEKGHKAVSGSHAHQQTASPLTAPAISAAAVTAAAVPPHPAPTTPNT
eukprot:m.317140 g.317140  ORF g.317140 m.317140 type:complete len:588 (-) comp19684_c1_seq8:140-1903(-)